MDVGGDTQEMPMDWMTQAQEQSEERLKLMPNIIEGLKGLHLKLQSRSETGFDEVQCQCGSTSTTTSMVSMIITRQLTS